MSCLKEAGESVHAFITKCWYLASVGLAATQSIELIEPLELNYVIVFKSTLTTYQTLYSCTVELHQIQVC